MTMFILRARLSWSACLLGLPCLVGTLLRLDVVAVLELLLLDVLTHLEHVADGLEHGPLLAAREGHMSIITNRRSPLARDPSRGGGAGSEGSTVLGPRVAPHLWSNIRSRSRRLPVQILLEHTDWVQRLRNITHMAHRLNQCLNKGSI